MQDYCLIASDTSTETNRWTKAYNKLMIIHQFDFLLIVNIKCLTEFVCAYVYSAILRIANLAYC